MSNKNIKKYLVLACAVSIFAVGGVQSSYASSINKNTKQIVCMMNDKNTKKSHKKHKQKKVKEEEYFLESKLLSDFLVNKKNGFENDNGSLIKKLKMHLFIQNIINDIMIYFDLV